MGKFLKKAFIYTLMSVANTSRICWNGFLAVLYYGRKRVVPPVKNVLLLKSATSLAADIREERIKCEDVVKAYIERINEVNPYINAIADDRFKDALREAQEVDKLVASHTLTPQQLQEEKPLLGVPITVKLLIGVKGLPCNAGSLLHTDLIAYEDAEVVALVKKAGAICLATTNSPEFGIHFETYNSVYGRTLNPYDLTRTPGGSSGGEGAIIGSAASVLGIGNDLAGSIRHPSNFNGIFGHKPTVDLVSNAGMFPILTPKLNKSLSTGPMCRYAEDLILSMKIMSGLKSAQMNLNEPVDFTKLKIFYMLDMENSPAQKVCDEIKGKILDALNHFQSTYGSHVKQVNIRKLRMAGAIHIHAHMMALEDKNLSEILTNGKFEVNPNLEILKAIFGQSKFCLGSLAAINVNKFDLIFNNGDSLKMERHLQKVKAEFEAILDDNSVLFMPSFPTAANHHRATVPMIANVSFMCLFNVLGNPVTQCPAGLNSQGLPIGFQVVAAQNQDSLSLACALELEKVFGGWVPPGAQEEKRPPLSH